MILVDTYVVSEPLRRVPEPCVAEWLDKQALETLNLSAITVAELRFGVRGRVLAFDLAASQAYAELMAKARSAGRAISPSDGYIAATAAANAMMVATRGTVPYEAAGLKTVDPWAM